MPRIPFSRAALWRALRDGCVIALLALVIALIAAPARADWHHCWHCGPRVAIGFGYYPPAYYYPPVYYAPPVYYYPPPAYYAPAPLYYAPAPVSESCTNGQWRQEDGSTVNGVACRQPDGSWKLAD